jgi:hypothetical protein
MQERTSQKPGISHATKGTVVIPAQQTSPYNGSSWGEVFDLMQERFSWEAQDLSLDVFDAQELEDSGSSRADFEESCSDSSMLVAVGIQQASEQQIVSNAYQSYSWPIFMALDSAQVHKASA